MKKKFRVKTESDFQRVFDQGQSKANKQFVIYQLEKEGQDYFRVGISVGKKLGPAVIRNRIKRRIRASIYNMREEIKDEVDFIIIGRQPTVHMSQAEIEKSLRHVLSLSHLLQDFRNEVSNEKTK